MRIRMTIIAAGASALIAFGLSAVSFADQFSAAGLATADVQRLLVDSVASGSPSLPSGLNKLGADARVGMVRAAGELAIAYTKTDDFRQRYAAWRTSNAPKLKLITPAEMAERNARTQAEFDKQQANLNSAAAKMEAQRANFRKAGMTDAQIDALVAQMKAMQGQVAQMRAKGQIPSHAQLMTEADRQQQNAVLQQAYDKAKAGFDRDHPADPAVMLRRKLQYFLTLSATVDFNAKVDKGNFVNADYQNRSDDWKLCFRAGKPAVDTARDIATQWLKQL